MAPRINITSVLVDDQDKAHRFYTEALGFVTKHNIDMGGAKWLTVVSPSDPEGTELLLEPDAHPAAKPFKDALVADGIPTRSSRSTTSPRSTTASSASAFVSRRSRLRWAT